MKGCLKQLAFLLFMAALFLGTVYGVASLFRPPSRSARVVRLEVPRHAGIRAIAELLQAQGLIRHRYAFMLMARLLGESKDMKAGEYELQPRMSLLEIIDKLARGDAVAVWFTVPEGYTVSQVADTLSQVGMIERHRFLRLADSNASRFDVGVKIPRRSLEGYLFPDSYKFKKGVTEKTILLGMLHNFHDKVVDGLADDVHASRLPLDKVVTAASLIEREARIPEDRPMIAAVIYNRLKRRMPLQIDASVLYALGHHKQKVMLADLKVNSPYNTYQHPGLPPGPICSPGLDSIKAALRPARVDYLYYVARADGHHIFSTTLAEHNSAVKRARSGAT
jgi:UPF0755 protein